MTMRTVCGVLIMLSLARSVSAQVFCDFGAPNVPPVISPDSIQRLNDIVMQCTGGPAGPPGTTFTSNLILGLNAPISNNATTGPPVLTVLFDQCTYLNAPINCPPGVPAGSNSLFIDPNGNVVFPGPNGTQITVLPSSIFPYSPPVTRAGVVQGNTVVFNGVSGLQPFSGGRLKITLGGLRANAQQLAYKPIFGSVTSSSTLLQIRPPSQTLFPGSNNVLLGVVLPPAGPTCESLLVLNEPGATPFLFGRNVLAGGSPFNVLMTLTTPQPSQNYLNLFSFAPSTDTGCQGTSFYIGATGTLDLQNVMYSGDHYFIQAQAGPQLDTRFLIYHYGLGTPPPP